MKDNAQSEYVYKSINIFKSVLYCLNARESGINHNIIRKLAWAMRGINKFYE